MRLDPLDPIPDRGVTMPREEVGPAAAGGKRVGPDMAQRIPVPPEIGLDVTAFGGADRKVLTRQTPRWLQSHDLLHPARVPDNPRAAHGQGDERAAGRGEKQADPWCTGRTVLRI